MTARKPKPKTLANIEPDPADGFDVEGWLRGFKPATVKATLFRRGDLIPRIIELQARIGKIAPSEETSIGDDEEYVRLVTEHNALAEELQASGEVFEFLPMDQTMVKAAAAKAAADGIDQKDDPEGWGIYLIAETCVSHPWLTGAHLIALRKEIGDVALSNLGAAFNEAQELGAQVDAPFSPLPLLTPGTGEQPSA